MKLRHLPIAAAALLMGQAHALDIATINNAATVKVYASGASAIRNIVGQVFVQNCDTGLDIYFSSGSTTGYPTGTTSSFSSSEANGNSHRVYSCTLKPEAGLEASLQGRNLGGKNVAFFKRDAGGSGLGVFPVALGSNAGNLLLDASFCRTTGSAAGFDSTTGSTTASYTCIREESVRAPELGFSDVEPALFKGINTPSGFSTGGLSGAQLSALTVTPTFQTVMAVAVSNALYAALQSAQGTSGRPSISRSVAGSLFRGELPDPQNGLGWQALGVANATSQVNVCRRTQGSGTQAAANVLFSNFPCAGTAGVPPAVNSDSEYANTLTPDSWTDGGLFVYEGSSTGNVISCLSNANTAGAYAVGHVSRENAENSAWKFVSLDGVEPSRDNLKAGKYDYAVESTAQYRTSVVNALAASASATDKAKAGFIRGFVQAVGVPANMDKLAAATKQGLAALPSAGTYNDPNDPIAAAFVSRVTRFGNNCSPLSVVQ